jgi:hypothetical protein
MPPPVWFKPLQPATIMRPTVKAEGHRTGKQREARLRLRLLALCNLPILTYFAYQLD